MTNRYKFNAEGVPKKINCPYCNTELDGHEGVGVHNPDNRPPQPGDISMCIECGEPGKFGEGLVMLKLTDDELVEVMKEPSIREAQRIIRSMKSNNQVEQARKYAEQVVKMGMEIRNWVSINKGKSPAIQYNTTEKVGIIGTFMDAVKNKFVSVNSDALMMATELGWMTPNPSMPTVFQVKAAMEVAFESDKE